MNEGNTNENELIVLIHGFGTVRIVMWLLARRLRANGFRVVHWNYLSLFSPIESHAKRLHDFLVAQNLRERRFHIVAHSGTESLTTSKSWEDCSACATERWFSGRQAGVDDCGRPGYANAGIVGSIVELRKSTKDFKRDRHWDYRCQI
jgi:hypothetical protein